ncbi:hypothetical protein EHS39_09120 [Ensifer sp. MPMI2T]|nr:hypothetical protein EHS39_09120 [Ensifer sp. MPMI2T]
MSLNRTIARLAVVSALNNYMQQPWPTLAGPNIFDSKIEPVEDMKTDRAFPCCVVYTDYDKDHWNKGAKVHAERLLTVTLELLVVQTERMDNNGDEIAYKLECPTTDSEIETSLDLFEVQIFRALAAGTEASDAFNYLCPSYFNVISRRGATVEGGQRLAARQITMELKALRDPVAGTIPPEVARFLDRLEQHDDYRQRVDDLRTLLTAPASTSPGDRVMLALGWTRDMADRMGAPTGPQVILPANLTYTYPTGSPPP